jgi:4-alpha-glucanotransferase
MNQAITSELRESKNMSKSVALLLGVHAHQPVGNFPHVLDDAHRRCYQPFLHMMHRFPDFPFAIHFSGWLFDYLLEHYPDDIRLLREMVARGQAELFGAGYTEPVLAAIPTHDRIGQINRMSDRLQGTLGQRFSGAWLTERVWESNVVPALVDCGVKYVTVDDYHFLCAGKENAELTGYYSTEEDGRRLDMYPISEALRYRLPFSPAADAVRYLESLAGEHDNAAVYFDDIEKFGIWPETYEWVYEKGWLTNFIEGVLASDVIKPMRYCDYHAQARTRGVVYLPTTSYIEMNEWTLPAPAAHRFADLVQEIKNQGRYDDNKAFLRGGIWRNFFSRYPESNWMHKRMLQLSARYAALPQKKKTVAMREALYEAQANDAYWHGLFGGLYLPHLRRAVYNAIVRLEGLLDAVAKRPQREERDLDLDGNKETFLHNGVLQAVVMGDGSASLCELDAYALNHNFADTLARQVEHYHRKIGGGQSGGGQQTKGIANPHEHVSFKHEIRPEDLVTDAHRRTLFLDCLYPTESRGAARPVSYLPMEGRGAARPVSYLPLPAKNAAQAGYVAKQEQGTIRKQIVLKKNILTVEYQFEGGIDGMFEVELNLAMPSCDGPAGCFMVGGQVNGGFGQLHQLVNCSEITLQDEVLGGKLTLTSNHPAALRSAPCFSVSQSEAGFEKIMQAVTLQLSWPVADIGRKLAISIVVE